MITTVVSYCSWQMATLDVHEAMGQKGRIRELFLPVCLSDTEVVDREAVATLVLPQLWAMSMGPLLSVEQFTRFMK